MDIAYLCADAVIEKTKQLAVDVKQYQRDKAERDIGSVGNMESVKLAALARVVELEFQYGVEDFEVHQKEAEKAMTEDNVTKNVSVKSGESR